MSLSDTPMPNIFDNFAGVVCSPITELVDTGEVREIKTPIKRVIQVPIANPLDTIIDDKIAHDDLLEFEMQEIDDFDIEYESIMKEQIVGYRYGIRYSEIQVLTMKVVQMQQTEINNLAERIKYLEKIINEKLGIHIE